MFHKILQWKQIRWNLYYTLHNEKKTVTYLKFVNSSIWGDTFLYESLYLSQLGEYLKKYIFTLWKNWTRL